MFFKQYSENKNLGFSLIEMMVTLAIIGLITAIILYRYDSFNSSVLLKNQAYEIALDIREAQVFANSVRAADQDFYQEYGMFFSKVSDPNVSDYLNDSYIFYQDSDDESTPPSVTGGNLIFNLNDPLSEQIGPTRHLDSRFVVYQIRTNGSGGGVCSDFTAYAFVVFQRPDFDANIIAYDQNTGTFYSSPDLCIRIAPAREVEIEEGGGPAVTNYLDVKISSTGQVSVQ